MRSITQNTAIKKIEPMDFSVWGGLIERGNPVDTFFFSLLADESR